MPPVKSSIDPTDRDTHMISRRLLLVASTALAALCATLPAQAQDKVELTLALPSPGGLGYFALYNAMANGYFEEEGIVMNPQSVNGSAQVIQALLAGQAQLGHPGPGPTLTARQNGADIVYIYNYFTRSQFNLVTTGDRPYSSPLELKGKTIGVGTSDGAEVAFVRAIFDDVGMKEGEDYKFITVGEGGMAVAGFMQNAIDAYASDTAGVATMQLRGVDLKILTPDKFKGYFGNGYVVTREYLEKNRDVLERFGRALVKGAKFGLDQANEEKTLENARMGNPQQLENMDYARSLMKVYYNLTTARWEATLVAAGDLKAPLPDLTAAYSNEFVPAWNAQ
jgi:NitT/TauT family transport system substrate-binding protein